LSFPAYIEKSQRRKAAAVSYAAWSEDFPDPSNYLDALFNGETISDRDCQNLAFYNNPDVNALLKTAASSLNVKERLGLYQKAEALIVDDAPWVFLVCLKQYVLHQPWVKNTKPHVVWPFRFEKMWIDR
jgi:ABC-type oligopeptide transport system substrate-binding subunit